VCVRSSCVAPCDGRGAGDRVGGWRVRAVSRPASRAAASRRAIRHPIADGAFTVCKIPAHVRLLEPEGFGWSTDYPYAGINLMTRL
jgi:hypothetical protein